MKVDSADRVESVQVAIVLDRSGSMEECREATISGFNEYVKEIRKTAREEGLNARVTLMTFNQEVTPVYFSAPLDRLQPIDERNYQPGGSTAMLDAVGETLDRLTKIEHHGKMRAMVCIISDGLENASRRYTRADVAERIQQLQGTDRWTFTYLGSNQDLTKVAADLGVPEANVARYASTAEGTRRAWQVHSARSRDRLHDLARGVESRGFYAEEGIADLTGEEEEPKA